MILWNGALLWDYQPSFICRKSLCCSLVGVLQDAVLHLLCRWLCGGDWLLQLISISYFHYNVKLSKITPLDLPKSLSLQGHWRSFQLCCCSRVTFTYGGMSALLDQHWRLCNSNLLRKMLMIDSRSVRNIHEKNIQFLCNLQKKFFVFWYILLNIWLFNLNL